MWGCPHFVLCSPIGPERSCPVDIPALGRLPSRRLHSACRTLAYDSEVKRSFFTLF